MTTSLLSKFTIEPCRNSSKQNIHETVLLIISTINSKKENKKGKKLTTMAQVEEYFECQNFYIDKHLKEAVELNEHVLESFF